ncbi:MAG: bifunctional nuclease domain-containing protein [Bacteroidota bacterium]
MDRVQVDILGLSTNQASGGAYALILKEVNGARRLPIVIGASEAQSIALEMEGIKPPRPLTHDLMKNIITAFGAQLSEITIDDLRDGTFYAKLSIDNQLIDSRPSDAIALAVRYGVQIYVAASVMDEASFVPGEGEEEEEPPAGKAPRAPKEAPAQPALSRLEQLQQQLREAVEKEQYEKAALVRDEIRRLESRE